MVACCLRPSVRRTLVAPGGFAQPSVNGLREQCHGSSSRDRTCLHLARVHFQSPCSIPVTWAFIVPFFTVRSLRPRGLYLDRSLQDGRSSLLPRAEEHRLRVPPSTRRNPGSRSAAPRLASQNRDRRRDQDHARGHVSDGVLVEISATAATVVVPTASAWFGSSLRGGKETNLCPLLFSCSLMS